MSKITVNYLNEILDYDMVSGDFYWKEKNSNPRRPGTIAGSIRKMVSNNKYRYIMIDGKHYSAHRLAWLYATGKLPDGQVDHIDGNGLNNSFNNLRVVTHSDNQKNRRINKNNTSGICGVSWIKSRCRWVSNICVNGKLKKLGYFRNKEDAIASRKVAERKYGYHKNHGNMTVLQAVGGVE